MRMRFVLPSIYEKLEYISNTNGGWILTNLYLTSKSTLNIKVQPLIKEVASFCGSTEGFDGNNGYITKNAIGLGISQDGNGFRFFWGSGSIQKVFIFKHPNINNRILIFQFPNIEKYE